jgi:hypothetical protein
MSERAIRTSVFRFRGSKLDKRSRSTKRDRGPYQARSIPNSVRRLMRSHNRHFGHLFCTPICGLLVPDGRKFIYPLSLSLPQLYQRRLSSFVPFIGYLPKCNPQSHPIVRSLSRCLIRRIPFVCPHTGLPIWDGITHTPGQGRLVHSTLTNLPWWGFIQSHYFLLRTKSGLLIDRHHGYPLRWTEIGPPPGG